MLDKIATASFAFLLTRWSQRLDEFENRIRDGAVQVYLKQFWERRLDANLAAQMDSGAAEALFNTIYCEHNGREAFISTGILLLSVTFLSAMMVAQTGIDACGAHACVGGAAQLGRFAPLGDITLPSASAAAIGGAYLFVVGDLILRARRRTLVVSDLAWYAMRFVLAIPIGLAFTAVAAPNVGALVAFGLGAFPLDSLVKQLRRLTDKATSNDEAELNNPDQLVQLDGVTVPISTQLAAEGIDSIDELVGTDPVLLSVRSGVPFASILRFASQAVVRMHFSQQASKLVPVALGNAYLIAQLVTDLDNGVTGSQQRLADAVSQLKQDSSSTVPSVATVEAGFRAIAKHGYTKFLIAVA